MPLNLIRSQNEVSLPTAGGQEIPLGRLNKYLKF